MATIKDLDLQRYTDGNYVSKYFQKTIRVPAGIGNESDAIQVVTRESIKVQIFNCALYESLSSIEEVENDTAIWELVSDGSTTTFPLDKGASFLKIVNDNAAQEAVMTMTGV